MTENSARAHRPTTALRRAKALPPWSLLAAGAVAGGLLGGAYGVVKPPVYTATAYVVAVPTAKSDPASALGFAQAYGRVATQLAVLGDAQVWAGVPARTLQQNVQTATSPDAPMVAITGTSSRPDLAADMANAVSRSLTQHARTTRATTNVELQQFARAVRPTSPSSASPAVTGLVGACAGGLLGGLVLLVRPRRAPQEEAARPAAVPGPALAADAHGAL
ncbi:lipopolysaccharide biosynthesis protein [Streptomyces sp. NBC_01275]|uniref:lipopolysaccharide biosynthesis protein n=1 Tax=Streptomyces sp. NBC_01275 TaxID=2903807 RepID=UPI00225333B1|nr:lipopolysaccharide biosynthesis protein [Streptomyces sp. NBC_01275]MCX4762260.1 lipopolysaccharide biosynthesis protein [Streptomyces sp. NBC_01275]